VYGRNLGNCVRIGEPWHFGRLRQNAEDPTALWFRCVNVPWADGSFKQPVVGLGPLCEVVVGCSQLLRPRPCMQTWDVGHHRMALVM
jgi:hypothetical protein